MRSYVKIFTPFLLAILLGSLTVIFAQTSKESAKQARSNNNFTVPPPPPPGFAPRGGLPHHLLEQLDLTDDQITKIGNIRENGHNAALPYFEKVKAADEKLRELAPPDYFNETQARQILTAKGQAMTELELIRLRTDAEIYGVLTPRQISQVEILKYERPERPMPPPDGFRHPGGFKPAPVVPVN